METVHIFSIHHSPRLHYTLEFIFKEILLLQYKLTTNAEEFKNLNGCKINYSKFFLENSLQIIPVELLFERQIKPIEPDILYWKNHLAIFKTTDDESEIPFDFFAAVFFLLSRYEEYLPHIQDIHGRFEAANSFAFKQGFLRTPLIDIWCYEIKNILQEKFQIHSTKKRSFYYLSTFDIDNAFAYKNKSVVRTFAASIKEILTFKIIELKNRWQTVLNFSADPYDTYKYILDTKTKFGFETIFFFLIGDYQRHDKNLHYKNKKFRELISSIGKESEVGIHPSYFSNKKNNQVELEKKRLEEIIEKKITASRQHYLKLQLPETYRNLCALDIEDDYTMGYSEQPGFRASTCTPFYFYDLEKEQTTNLKIHPFAYMDVTLHTYLKLLPTEAVSVIESMLEDVKKVEGCFISLWHNESLSEDKRWKGWRFVFESNLKSVFEK